MNRRSDENPESLRISADAKAKVNTGEFSRNGKSRDPESKKAADHDMNPKCKLIPYGILNVLTGLLTIFMGTSSETGDFIADCIEMWWDRNKDIYRHIKELVINLDNGPNSSGGRTQFIRRMTEFADKTGLRIRLIYYPPYHSKYNPVERCWGILEEHWNGELPDSVEKTVNWAAAMTWKGVKPVVYLWEKLYKKGIRLTKKEMKPFESRIERSDKLPKWDVTINPMSG
ncbi:MAG: transposase [Desulfobacterales bacterium]